MSRGAIETGKRYGRWTVIRRVKSERPGAVWLCKCDCGSRGKLTGSSLRGGWTTQCRKCAGAGRVRDLKGQVFGRLTVLREAGRDEHGSVLWVCRCSCGKKKIAHGNHLTRGSVKSCGCLTILIDLTGQTFGRWTVLKHLGTGYTEAGNNRGAVFLCRCACGVEKVLDGFYLRQSNPVGCRECYRLRVTVPEAERFCRWCKRSTAGHLLPRECDACNRRAHRNGRDAEGRPVEKQPRVAKCEVCGVDLPKTGKRFKACLAPASCWKTRKLRADLARNATRWPRILAQRARAAEVAGGS